MLQEFLSSRWLDLHGLVALLGLVIYAIGSHARRQRRHPSAAIAWIVSLALLPYLALPLYLLLGSRKVLHDPGVRALPLPPFQAGKARTPAARFQHLTAAMGLPVSPPYQQLVIHEDGKAALQSIRAVMAG